MKYTRQEVMQYVQEDDVKFIRLAFCDVFGKQKNISIMPQELPRAFEYGIAIDASAIAGFGDETRSDLLLHPDPATISQLPWRPEHGKVVRMFSSITYPNGNPFECDTRSLLVRTVEKAQREGLDFFFGTEQEFYLFKLDEYGKPTREPYDMAGYMDIAPDDRGENIRREICLTLEQMGIRPESSHHEEGPGQNEIDFRYADPVTAADNALTFQTIVRTVAHRNGLYADFSPKPLADQPGSGLHINMSVKQRDGADHLHRMIAGILDKAVEMTAFLNPCEQSYARLGSCKAPGYVSWSAENRSQFVRVPAAEGEYRRAELRSADSFANPYLAFALLIEAGMRGIQQDMQLPAASNLNLFRAQEESLASLQKLPQTLEAARAHALQSSFIQGCLPKEVIEIYCGK